jgi:bifunctional DNase/RNase
MSGQTAPRPLTHDVMATIVEALEGRVDAAEVSELRDGAFLAS